MLQENFKKAAIKNEKVWTNSLITGILQNKKNIYFETECLETCQQPSMGWFDKCQLELVIPATTYFIHERLTNGSKFIHSLSAVSKLSHNFIQGIVQSFFRYCPNTEKYQRENLMEPKMASHTSLKFISMFSIIVRNVS